MRRIALLALALLLAGCTPAPRTNGTTTDAPDSGPAPDGPVGTVEDVLDGDSLRMVIDGTPTEVRLLGINAPERDECWADEARDALADDASGRDLVVVASGQDQYGRVVARLHDGTSDIGLAMLEQGHAIALALEHDRRAEYLAAEDDAMRLERGLWAPDACGPPLGDHGIVIWGLEPDAPGRDDVDPNGEWIAIANEGETVVDIGGWSIRDESSVHRYVFEEGFTLGPGQIVTIRSGCGSAEPFDLHWCADTPVWTNSGDTALLLGPSGQVVGRFRYLED